MEAVIKQEFGIQKDYAKEKGIDRILKGIITSLAMHRPADVLDYMIRHLEKPEGKSTDMAKVLIHLYF